MFRSCGEVIAAKKKIALQLKAKKIKQGEVAERQASG
jgi:hypothetical protein